MYHNITEIVEILILIINNRASPLPKFIFTTSFFAFLSLFLSQLKEKIEKFQKINLDHLE